MTDRRKILTIFGTRPEAIKMAPVVKALQRYPDWFETRVVVTGQHREQLDQVLRHFAITPDHDLNIMQERQTLTYIVTAALQGLDRIIASEQPDMVLVHGDTHTTFVGALAAFYHQVAVAHVEAGLRTFHKYSPFPEELNRRLTGVLADLHFAPTRVGWENLRRENVPAEQIFITGQTGIDAALATHRPDYAFIRPELNRLDFAGRRVIAVTAHRRENWGEPFRQMFTAMRRLVDDHPDVVLVYPVHYSPAVRDAAFPILGGHDRILLLDPIDYPDMINLMARSYLVMADSGGLQEEAPCFGVPMVLMRDTTERPEALEAGTLVLAGTAAESVYGHAARLLNDRQAYTEMARAVNPFGDGRASERIAQYLACYWGLRDTSPEPFVRA